MVYVIAQLRSITDAPDVAKDSFEWLKVAIPLLLIGLFLNWLFGGKSNSAAAKPERDAVDTSPKTESRGKISDNAEDAELNEQSKDLLDKVDALCEDVSGMIEKIRLIHKCEPSYAGFERVKYASDGQNLWEGVVEIFKLSGHPKAQRCYAWYSYEDCGQKQLTIMLDIHPVNSPRAAVKETLLNRGKAF